MMALILRITALISLFGYRFSRNGIPKKREAAMPLCQGFGTVGSGEYDASHDRNIHPSEVSDRHLEDRFLREGEGFGVPKWMHNRPRSRHLSPEPSP